MLMSRGPQTVAELHINCERPHKFADISSVESLLVERVAGGLVAELPRQPGSRENRWMHVFCGEPVIDDLLSVGAASATRTGDVTVGEIAVLTANIAKLEAEAGELWGMVAKLCAELGISAK